VLGFVWREESRQHAHLQASASLSAAAPLGPPVGPQGPPVVCSSLTPYPPSPLPSSRRSGLTLLSCPSCRPSSLGSAVADRSVEEHGVPCGTEGEERGEEVAAEVLLLRQIARPFGF
jgi:hypothetical protein